jgi:hypothetical protein
MILPFDIFQVPQDSHPLWLESASTLEEATARVNELGKFRPGEYLILSQETGQKISIIAGQDELGS